MQLPSIEIVFCGPEDFVAFIDDPRARQRVRIVELVIDPWFEVKPGWTGRLGPLRYVISHSVEFGKSRASVRVATSRAVEAVHVVRAIYPLFYPTRPGTSGLVGPRIGVQEGAQSEMRWSPGGGLRPLARAQLAEGDHIDFDLIANSTGLYRTDRDTQQLKLVERSVGPLVQINPRVHSPVGRHHSSATAEQAFARTQCDRFVVESFSGEGLIDIPIERRLGPIEMRALSTIGNIDASGVQNDLASTTRLAELAAHGLPVHSASADRPLHREVLRTVSAPWVPLRLLDYMNRSLAQVRAVMSHHAWYGWQGPPLPVSVLLVTRRPEFLPVILNQMAMQSYPSLEVVVACHGFSSPERMPWPEEFEDRLGSVIEVPSELSFGEALGAASAAASGHLLTKIDDDDLYGPDHVRDVTTAWRYSSAQLVGRKLALIRQVETDQLIVRRLFHESYRSRVAGGSLTIAKDDLATIGGWRPQGRGIEGGLGTRLNDAGGLHYACSGPGYVHQRHLHDHTWKVGMEHFHDKYYDSTVDGLPNSALGILDDVTLAGYSNSPG